MESGIAVTEMLLEKSCLSVQIEIEAQADQQGVYDSFFFVYKQLVINEHLKSINIHF